ncbi:periplasmic binding protein-like I [Obelidium mucronatum]|nr:periplasmic binding protein-like I [Obelidium mucronatum]
MAAQGSTAHPLASKGQSSITIGFIGPYTCIPGLGFDGRLVVEGYEAVDKEQLFWTEPNIWGCGGWWFWDQFGASAAVDEINANPDILPNTTIKIKRFFDYLEDYQRGSSYDSGGLAMNTALDIYENHTDVVSVFGGLYTSTIVQSAAVYSALKIPYCTATAPATQLSNANNYPYFFQTSPGSSIGDAVATILTHWKVSRAAVISVAPLIYDSTGCKSIVDSLPPRGIEITTIIQNMNHEYAEYIIRQLQQADAKYIILCGSSLEISSLYLTLAVQYAKFVGPDYVWIVTNYPSNAYGADFAPFFEGVVGLTRSTWSTKLLDEKNKALSQAISDSLKSYDRLPNNPVEMIMQKTNARRSYDCIGLLATAIDQALRETETTPTGEVRLPKYLPRASFQNTGYSGVVADPVVLRSSGNLVAPSGFYSLTVDPSSGSMTYFVIGHTDVNRTRFIPNPDTSMIFNGGGTLPPPDSSRLEYDFIDPNSIAGTFVYVSTAIGAIVSTASFLIIVCNQSNSKVRAGSALFSSLSSFGSTLGILSNLGFIGEPNEKKHKQLLWMQYIAFATVAGSLLAKNSRVCIIFLQGMKAKKKYLADKFWILAFACVVLLQAILVALYTTIPKYNFSKYQIPSTLTVQIRCDIIDTSHTFYPLFLYQLILIGGLAFIGYLSREVRASHSENMIISLFVWASITAFVFTSSISQSGGSHIRTILVKVTVVWILAIIPVVWQLGTNGVAVFGHFFKNNPSAMQFLQKKKNCFIILEREERIRTIYLDPETLQLKQISLLSPTPNDPDGSVHRVQFQARDGRTIKLDFEESKMAEDFKNALKQ